eukprot:TRINITY_DN985_c0_g2_i1.p2 TRINITY_DN985_c0_g2~~TRINITY_DN985_c0_g2_i1.p2  ORF type:complete len:264 (+),score=72.21 TRINITY_DN985_c0_g2_i1:93-794(+)
MADPSKVPVQKEDEDEHVEEENAVHFDDGAPAAPILPQCKVETGEENDEVLWEKRCKLHRRAKDLEGKECWKERGVGVAKLLFNTEKKVVRFLMRREGTLKLAAHHIILSSLKLTPMAGSQKSFIWAVPEDFADSDPVNEIFAIQFGQVADAAAFRAAFEVCADIADTDDKGDLPAAVAAAAAAAHAEAPAPAGAAKKDEEKKEDEKKDEDKEEKKEEKKEVAAAAPADPSKA